MSSRSKTSSLLAVTACWVLAAAPAWSEEISQANNSTQPELTGSVFLGAGVGPDYEGSEDYTALPLVGGRLQYDEYYVETAGLGLRLNAVNSKRFNAGPVLNYRMGRDDIENDVVERLGDIDDAVEAGAFARLNFENDVNARYKAGVELQFLTDVSDTHEGWLARLGADYSAPVREKLTLGVDISTTYASDDYMDTYFGVDAAGAAASGLRTFEGEAGFKDVALGVNARYALNENWGLFARVQYTQLVGDAADSPIVDDEGSASQIFGGIGVSYRF